MFTEMADRKWGTQSAVGRAFRQWTLPRTSASCPGTTSEPRARLLSNRSMRARRAQKGFRTPDSSVREPLFVFAFKTYGKSCWSVIYEC